MIASGILTKGRIAMDAEKIKLMLEDVSYVESLGDKMPWTVLLLCSHVRTLAACVSADLPVPSPVTVEGKVQPC